MSSSWTPIAFDAQLFVDSLIPAKPAPCSTREPNPCSLRSWSSAWRLKTFPPTPHQVLEALLTQSPPSTPPRILIQKTFPRFCWHAPRQGSGEGWGAGKWVCSSVGREMKGFKSAVPLNFSPPNTSDAFHTLIICTKQLQHWGRKGFPGGDRALLSHLPKEKWEGWEESSLWRMTTRREKPGEKVRSQMCHQDMSQLEAATKMHWLRGDEGTKGCGVTPGCCWERCSSVGNFQTHLLQAHPAASAPQFVLPWDVFARLLFVPAPHCSADRKAAVELSLQGQLLLDYPSQEILLVQTLM